MSPRPKKKSLTNWAKGSGEYSSLDSSAVSLLCFLEQFRDDLNRVLFFSSSLVSIFSLSRKRRDRFVVFCDDDDSLRNEGRFWALWWCCVCCCCCSSCLAFNFSNFSRCSWRKRSRLSSACFSSSRRWASSLKKLI